MNKINALQVDMEAAPFPSLMVENEVYERDLKDIRGTQWSPADTPMNLEDPMVAPFVKWLGQPAMRLMDNAAFDVLKRAITNMPSCVDSEKFVWDAIKTPTDFMSVGTALASYRSFNVGSLKIIDQMGTNTEIRSQIRQIEAAGDTLFSEIIGAQMARVNDINSFNDQIEAIVPLLTAVFGEKEFSVGAVITLVAAMPGIRNSLIDASAEDFSLAHTPDETLINEFDQLRVQMVEAAEFVNELTSINPLLYNIGVLSGIRRSLTPDSAIDFKVALAAIGGIIDNEGKAVEAASAFRTYLHAATSFKKLLDANGYEDRDASRILNHILVRRHMMSAAQVANVNWIDVAPILSLKPELSLEPLQNLVSVTNADQWTGRLRAVANGFEKPVESVLSAGRYYVTTRKYWLNAAGRIVELNADLTIDGVRDVIRIEPQVIQIQEALSKFGASTTEEIDELEQHLKWMTAAYALPIDDEAFAAIVNTKAAIMPLDLCKPDSIFEDAAGAALEDIKWED